MNKKWGILVSEAKEIENLAARVVCVGPNSTILLIKRAPETPINGGMWDIPGGHVDEDDRSLEFAACREIDEETGLIFSENELVYLGRNDWKNDVVYYYGVYSTRMDVKLLPNPESGFIEHTDYEWVTIDQIKEYEKQELTTFPIYLLRMALERVQKQ